MIYWFTDEEKPIKRRKEYPNIGEQRRVVKEVANLGQKHLFVNVWQFNRTIKLSSKIK